MSDQVVAALIAAAAACVYVTGLALQQLGNERALAAGHRHTWDAPRQPIWWAGVGVMCIGFLVHGFSLSIGSLTVVQPVQVVQIVYAVAIDAWLRKRPARRADWSGAALIVAGLAAFMLALQPTPGTDFASDGSWAWILTAMVGAGALLSLGAWAMPPARAVLLGALAGMVWGVQGALLKETAELVEDGLADAFTAWPVYATAVLGLVGLTTQNVALRAGRLAVAAALITVVNPIVASTIGLAAFDETMRTGVTVAAVAIAAAVAVVWGVALLARTTASLVATRDARPSSGLTDA